MGDLGSMRSTLAPTLERYSSKELDVTRRARGLIQVELWLHSGVLRGHHLPDLELEPPEPQRR